MQVYVALLRGINVGGRNRLAMKDLVELVCSLGGKGVRTYIQSGNVVFGHAAADTLQLGQQLSDAIRAYAGFAPHVLIMTAEVLDAAVAANPYPEAVVEPKTLHVSFLAREPAHPDIEALERLRDASERFVLRERTLYLHAPNGVGRSKLAPAIEKKLGVPTTDRNWRTVVALQELAQAFVDSAGE